MIKWLNNIGRPSEFPRIWEFLGSCKNLLLFFLDFDISLEDTFFRRPARLWALVCADKL